uniref:Secreted protein n=1 Tax=Steinernema glaseri TaxID=37863 RepID=A0A1I7ZXZ3_9BILA
MIHVIPRRRRAQRKQAFPSCLRGCKSVNVGRKNNSDRKFTEMALIVSRLLIALSHVDTPTLLHPFVACEKVCKRAFVSERAAKLTIFTKLAI